MSNLDRKELQNRIRACKTREDLQEMETYLKRQRISPEGEEKVAGGTGRRVALTPEETEKVSGGVYYFTEPQSGMRIPFHKDGYSMGTDYWYDQAAIIECMFEAGGYDMEAVTDFIVSYYGGTATETREALAKGPFFWADSRRKAGN